MEKFASIRTQKAIKKADIAILVLEAISGITSQEKRIAEKIYQEKKACILLFNKWDLVKGFRQEHCKAAIKEEVSFLGHCPMLFVSAKRKSNLSSLFPAIERVVKEYHKRISTGKLNSFIEKCLQEYHPPMIKGKRLRIYYMTQVAIAPPRFVLFVNYPSLFL